MLFDLFKFAYLKTNTNFINSNKIIQIQDQQKALNLKAGLV